MFAAESYISRHYIAIVAMACLCVLLGGPSCAAGAESLFIAGATYREPGVSGPGWSWTDAGHLELDGYAGDAIGAGGDLVVTLVGQNSVTESHAPDADITQCGMEVWGDLTLRGTGSLAASGSQCAIHVSQALAVEGCAVDARADGANVTDEAVAGLIAGGMAVRGGGRGSWLGRVHAFRRRLVARCDRYRWRCRMHGRVSCVRAVCDARGRGLRCRRRGGRLRGHGSACGG
ncbi:hypothetical protein [Collinsella aerofaciens]|uniref:hypothetical protein n=1 Tax=Collinsella aerofaciens TaxID=74426 RepID=UPI00319E3486